MKVNYDLKGLRQFANNVKKKPAQVQRAVNSELNRSALRVERQAKKYAPYDTGWLSNNIYSMGTGVLQYSVISPVGYSIYLELGTRYMAAQPYMYPALEDEYPLLMRRLKQIMGG